MKSLSSLDRDKQLAIVVGSRELKERLFNYIYDGEMDYINEKLSCFKSRSIDYEYGLSCYCYMTIENTDRAVGGVAESCRIFGASARVEKLLKHCQKLYGTNLYEYHAEKLIDAFHDDEIMPIIKFLEDISYSLYIKDIDEFKKLNGFDYFDMFVDNGGLDSYMIDEDENVIYQYSVVA